MFPSTQPMDSADSRPPPAPHTALSSLSPSLLQDLMRFESSGPQRELLEVLAACVRHTQALAITVAAPDQPPLVLSVFPTDRQVHCALPLADVVGGNLATLQVLEVLAACVRHTQALAITVAAPGQPPLVLSVFPTDRQVHCVLP